LSICVAGYDVFKISAKDDHLGFVAMTSLRLTAIMKTDISGSTARFRALREIDLAPLLSEHREFLSRLAAKQDGRIVKPQGDGFWIVFPSVTAAGLAAMAMQEELRLAQSNKGDDRLAMRIVLTLGDVLHKEGALVGDAVVLAARIEAITPPDEIYVSAAARLAMSQAEVRTALVDAFTLKGFTESVPVYRIEQTHRTQVITDQYIVFTDLKGFGKFTEVSPMTMVEKVLDRLLELVGQVCREFGGTNRFNAGDAYCMTFPDLGFAVAAAERLAEEWDLFERRERLGCSMAVAVHKGVLNAFRSYLYSRDLNVAARMVDSAGRLPKMDASVLVSGPVRRDVTGTPWEHQLQIVDIGPPGPYLAGLEIYRLRSHAWSP
jgi:class 3 adenylate cyclase